jgi:DNA-binding YbaB/EbfC family protein
MNLANMMKQAEQMQLKMIEIVGDSAGGMCQVTLNGKGEAKNLKIEPVLVTPAEIGVMEDLILAAFNDAKAKVEAKMQEKMSELTGGISLPEGFKLPF